MSKILSKLKCKDSTKIFGLQELVVLALLNGTHKCNLHKVDNCKSCCKLKQRDGKVLCAQVTRLHLWQSNNNCDVPCMSCTYMYCNDCSRVPQSYSFFHQW
jgi:hypothetical protein